MLCQIKYSSSILLALKICKKLFIKVLTKTNFSSTLIANDILEIYIYIGGAINYEKVDDY